MTEYFNLWVSKSEGLWAKRVARPKDIEISHCPAGDFGHWDGSRMRSTFVASVNHNRRDQLLINGWIFRWLIHASLVAEFEAEGFTGYRLKPAIVRFGDSRPSREYSELIVVGWAGIAREESGIHRTWRCPHCHRANYSPLIHPDKLIDWSQWTGEDFFTVWPLAGFTLITGRVAGFLRARKVKNCTIRCVEDSCGRGVTRLSSYMPDDVARKYGEPLGLETGTANWIPATVADVGPLQGG